MGLRAARLAKVWRMGREASRRMASNASYALWIRGPGGALRSCGCGGCAPVRAHASCYFASSWTLPSTDRMNTSTRRSTAMRYRGVRIKDGCVCVVEAPECESRGMRDESCVPLTCVNTACDCVCPCLFYLYLARAPCPCLKTHHTRGEMLLIDFSCRFHTCDFALR